MSDLRQSPQDIVVTGLGMLTAHGLGVDKNLQTFQEERTRHSQEDMQIKGFNPAPHLSDRKVVKVVSHRDVLGLVAFEECLKNAQLSAKTINPDRTGLYVGAPPSSCSDHHNYEEAITASADASGHLTEKNFGEHFRSASPTTLLTGLPNNVLCYGAKTLDARGPNSNYTTLETSSHMAMIGAIRAMRLGRLDCALAGGYSAHNDKLFISSMNQRGYGKGTPIAEGAAFVSIEQRAHAEKRGVKPICQVLAVGAASDACGPFGTLPEEPVLTDLIQSTIKSAGIRASDIQVVMTSGSGFKSIEDVETKAIASVWQQTTKPILATTATRWGNLMEAGGLAELGFLKQCFDHASMPQAAILSESLKETPDSAARSLNTAGSNRIAMIIRTSTWAEYTCLIVNMESP